MATMTSRLPSSSQQLKTPDSGSVNTSNNKMTTKTSAAPATVMTTAPCVIRTRPAFEKIFIGPLMVFGEMTTGGHYLEVLRLGKQMTVGHQAAPSYWNLHVSFVNESGGSFFGAFYRGFLPWGLLQCAKGIPVLFVQHESMYHLQQLNATGYINMSPFHAELLSGVLGGAAQAWFVCPFQKIKVTVVACQHMNSLGPWQASRQVVLTHGTMALFDGVLPMMLRRSLDWGIRFGVSSRVKHWMIERKRQRGESTNLKVYELIGCGLVGGASSASTHPIDNIITNSQKPLPSGQPRDIISVICRMYKESGYKAFTRAWGIKIIDNAYHMAWMYGIGTVAYDSIRKLLNGHPE